MRTELPVHSQYSLPCLRNLVGSSIPDGGEDRCLHPPFRPTYMLTYKR